MSTRDRFLGIALGVVVVLAVVAGSVWWVYSAYANAEAQVEEMERKTAEAKLKLEKVKKERPALEKWKLMSLPADLNEARAIYKQELLDMIRANTSGGGLVLEDFPQGPPDTKSTQVHPTKPPGKVPMWTGINYLVRLKTKMPNLVSLIQDFQKRPRMHRIKSMTIERTTDKKQPDMLNVQIAFEALSILDADAGRKDSKTQDVRRMAAIDTLINMRKGPPGLGMVTYALASGGTGTLNLNPPQSLERTYADIARKNVFVGWEPPEPVIKKGFTPKNDEVVTKRNPEDVINMMRFNRFISLTQDIDKGTTEAWLWDASTNHKERLRTIGGFNKFPMLQTPKLGKLVHGVVNKIEGNSVVFRVVLNATDPASPSSLDSKWWRYPIDENFYNLHKSDLAVLVKDNKAKASDTGKLYVVSIPYWEKLTSAKTKSTKMEVSKDKKTFRFAGDSAPGQVVHEDAKVVVIRMTSWPPKSPIQPNMSVDRLYVEPNVIYKAHKNHLADLVETKKVKAGEEDRVFVMRREYWDVLLAGSPALIKATGSGSSSGSGSSKNSALNFTFYSDLIKGKVWETPEAAILILDEQYCRFAGDREAKVAERWHEGFLVLPIGQVVQDALVNPLPKDRVKDFLPRKTTTTSTAPAAAPAPAVELDVEAQLRALENEDVDLPFVDEQKQNRP